MRILLFLTSFVWGESWETVAVESSLPSARSGHSLTAYDGILYLFGGCDLEATCYNNVEAFSVQTSLWSQVSTIGSPPAAREGHISVLIGHYLYIHGGSSLTSLYSDVYKLNLLTFEWTSVELAGSSSPIAYHSGVLHQNGIIFIFGGYTNEGISDEVILLDTVNKHWGYPAIVGQTPAGRKLHSLSRVGDRVWMFGGETDLGIVNELWYFELKLKHWYQFTGDSPASRSGHVTKTHGSGFYLFGGCNSSIRVCYADTYVFDTRTQSWIQLDSSETVKSREGLSADFIAGHLYLFAGRYLMEAVYGDFWVFETDQPCPNDCSSHGNCSQTGCQCDPGWGESDCSTPSTCRMDCNDHGICDQYECVCYPGYYGSYCQGVIACPNNCTNAAQGICQDSAQCICTSGYTGVDCSLRESWKICEDLCINGQCQNLDCVCNAGWVGTYCDISQPVIYSAASTQAAGSGGQKVKISKGAQEEDEGNFNQPIDASKVNLSTAAGNQDKAADAFGLEKSLHYLIPEMFGFVDGADPTVFYSKNLRRIPESHVKEDWIKEIEDRIEDQEDELKGCKALCSYHGTCSSGVCYCESGYTGDYCEIKTGDIEKGVKMQTALIVIICATIVGCFVGGYKLGKIMKEIKMREESKIENPEEEENNS